MNTKLVVILIAAVAVGAIAVATLGGSSNPSSNTPPAYVNSVTMDNAVFPDNNSATLYLREAGNATATLTSYRVTDTNGDSYFMTGLSNPTIAPSTAATVNILIGSACSSCALSGTTFTFTKDHTYSVTVYTSDGQQFSFQVTRRNSAYQVSLSVGFGTTGQP